ncbi:MAG TPA: nucleotide exchange factor GrpE [Bryobacteraceae bacterium]|jgi:molecular chaperone GrpE|nr:nucleotide exchange factor GrpE [Bryobacteraceae bacterium]
METVNSTADPQSSPDSQAEGTQNKEVLPDLAEQLAVATADRDQLAKDKGELQDLLQRRQAEFENFRRRVEREKTEVFDFASMDSVKTLLPVLDDFERALKVESTDKEYARGMELIYQRFYDLLKKLGLEPISTKDELFDPHVHHAVEMVDTDEYPDHTILEEYQRGYNFKGRLLRPAMVKVAVKH